MFRFASFTNWLYCGRRVPTLLEVHQPAARVTLFGWLPFSPSWPTPKPQFLWIITPLRFLLRKAAACAVFAIAPIPADAQTALAPETHGIVIANMDRSVKPGDDFYRYANGNWLKRAEIPPDRSYMDHTGRLGNRVGTTSTAKSLKAVRFNSSRICLRIVWATRFAVGNRVLFSVTSR